MVADPYVWNDFDLNADPVLVVGWRPKPKLLAGAVVDLHVDTFATLRQIAEKTIAEVRNRRPVTWEANAFIEPGEDYLVLASDAITGEAGSPLVNAAGLIQLVLQPGLLNNITTDQLGEGTLRFYGLIWESGYQTGPVAFVSEYDPTFVLRKASSFFRFDGTLRAADAPDFALNEQAELIITPAHIAALRASSFDRLFSDIRALLNDVPTYVKKLRVAMSNLPMSPATARAFEAVCARRPSDARRLQNLAENGSHTEHITPRSFSAVLRRHGRDPKDFISGGTLDVTEDNVSVVLDVAEGRLFEADFTSERRRAARWSSF